MSATLDRAVGLAREAAERHGLAMPDLGTFLAMRGVVETREIEADEEGLGAVVTNAFTAALGALAADRAREGEAVAGMLGERVDRIEALMEAAKADPSREPEAIRARLAERLRHLANTELDADRLHAEAAMLAVESRSLRGAGPARSACRSGA